MHALVAEVGKHSKYRDFLCMSRPCFSLIILQGMLDEWQMGIKAKHEPFWVKVP